MIPSDHIYDLNLKLFTASGFGYLENPTRWQKIFYRIYHILLQISYIFLSIFFYVDIYLVMNDREKLNFNLCVTIITSGSIVKMWAIMLKMKNLPRIHKNFKDFQSSRNEKVLKVKKVSAKLMTKITKFFYLMIVFGGALWILFPLIDPTTDERRFCIPFPLEGGLNSPKFELIYVYHAVLVAQFLYYIVSNDMLMIGFLIRLVEHLDILKINLKEIKNLYPYGFGEIENVGNAKRRHEETKNLMRENILYHKWILKQFELVQDTYAFPLFLNIMAGAVILSVVAVDVILQSRSLSIPLVHQIVYAFSVIIDLFVLSMIGTLIQSKSEEIVQTLYDLPWYEMDKSNLKILMFMITKCRKPPILRARYFFRVDLDTFQSLMKTSYNVMAVLNETK